MAIAALLAVGQVEATAVALAAVLVVATMAAAVAVDNSNAATTMGNGAMAPSAKSAPSTGMMPFAAASASTTPSSPRTLVIVVSVPGMLSRPAAMEGEVLSTPTGTWTPARRTT
jgi:hypothetical protein